MSSAASSPRYKLVFFSPPEPLERIKNAIFATGAGTYPGGKYTNCCFESLGTGQFLPMADKGANPTIGEKRDDGSGEFRLERVEEVRCEIMCVGQETTREAVKALKQ
jgi:hypothetical protein